jgi:S1-C subfamily serine protease
MRDAADQGRSSLSEWQITPDRQPRQDDYVFDLEQALAAIVGIRSIVPEEAFTADVLGTERSGSGVVIGDGLVLTIGYLVTEAREVWITLADGAVVPAHPIAYDQATGLGLVRALDRLPLPSLALGRADGASLGTRVIVAGAGGRRHSVAARIVAKQEFAGYWEYLLDEAVFTAPAHPFWGGAALIGPAGDVIGIGSLQVEQRSGDGEGRTLNMFVPAELLLPILDDLLSSGRSRQPPRPWLGVFTTEVEDRVFVAGTYDEGPAARAGLEAGDLIVAVAGESVAGLAGFYRKLWSLGPAGVAVPLAVYRDGNTIAVSVRSDDRDRFLWRPPLNA